MSSWGDGNIKSAIEDKLEWVFKDNFGHGIYEATAEEKLAFINSTLEVLAYKFNCDQEY